MEKKGGGGGYGYGKRQCPVRILDMFEQGKKIQYCEYYHKATSTDCLVLSF